MIFSFVGRKGDHVNVVINSEKLDLLVGGRGGWISREASHTHTYVHHPLQFQAAHAKSLPCNGILTTLSWIAASTEKGNESLDAENKQNKH